MSAVAPVAPPSCPACGGRRKVLLAEPGSPLFSVMLCPGCVWCLPVIELPKRGDR